MKRVFLVFFAFCCLIVSCSAINRIIFTTYYDENFTFQNQLKYGTYECGPTSISMIYDLLDIELQTVSVIRKQITDSKNSPIYTDDMCLFLDENKELQVKRMYLRSPEQLYSYATEYILLLCIDTTYIPETYRQYTGNFGHYIVCKGTVSYLDEMYLEILDPMNKEICYYKLEDVYNSASNWWPWFISIEKK